MIIRSALTRRGLLGRGLGIAGAAALPASLVTAAVAHAQETAQTDTLIGLTELEQAAELAYSLAAEDADLEPEAQMAFDRFSLHSGEHETALSEALEQLAADPPEGSDDPADYPSLDGFDSGASQDDLLAFMIDVELGLIELYEDDVPELDEPDLIRSAAQIAAGHAQQLVALRLLAGEDGALTELPDPSASATDSTPPDSSSSGG